MSGTISFEDHPFSSGDLDVLARERDYRPYVATMEVMNASPPTIERRALDGDASRYPARLTISGSHDCTLTAVRRNGPHRAPIEWTVFTPASTHRVVANGATLKVELAARARISCWVDAQGTLWNQQWSGELIKPGWSKSRFEGLDDVTLVATIVPTGKGGGLPRTDDVEWATNYPGGGSASLAAKFTKQSIDFFHSRGVQVFASVYLDVAVTANQDPARRFVRWLRAKADKETDVRVLKRRFAHHAQRVVRFFDEQGLDIDGLSYDLEIDESIGPGLALRASDRPALTALFQAMADELAKQGRYLAYATFAFANEPEGIMKAQPYDLAHYPNVIVRPMSYHGRRREVIRYALGQVSLHPGQLQVGVSTTRIPSGAKGPDGAQRGYVPDSLSSIESECGALERKYRVGVCHWALSSVADAEAYKRWNERLNPGLPLPGTRGQPLQGPLDGHRLQAMKRGS